MARATDGDVERIKREVSIKQLVESYGVELKKSGNDFLGHCPMHEDKTPSLVITPDKNLWHCLGACQSGGSVIDWVMKMEGVSFRHALDILKERFVLISANNKANKSVNNKKAVSMPGRAQGGNGRDRDLTAPLSPSFSNVVKHSTVKKLDFSFDSHQSKQELLNQVTEFYHQSLKESPEGLDYLKKRGLNNPELIDRFKLGLSNRSLCYRLPYKNREAGAEIRGKLQELGILRESGHEHFAGSLVIPVFDENNNVVEMYGRKTKNNLRKGTAYHLYLPGSHRGIWNFSCLAANKEIILCEALIDALTFWVYGFKNVTSSYGINGFTKDHLQAFKKYRIERILIAYDRDDAGDQAAESLAKKLAAENIGCLKIKFPLGLDANEFACENNKDINKAFFHLIRDALPLVGSIKPGGIMEMAAGEGDSQNPAPSSATMKVSLHIDENVAHQENKNNFFDSNNLEKKETAKEEKPESLVLPPAPQIDVPMEMKGEEIIIVLGGGQRRWRVRGLAKNSAYEVMKVNIQVLADDQFHVDTFDLYSARHRTHFIKQAVNELGVEEETIKKDLGKVLLKLEELQDKQIKKTLEPDKKEVVMSDEKRKEALELLRSPDLLDRILEDFKKSGVAGERTNKLVGYLASISRKLDSPLAVIIQSSSAAGKTWLMESVLSFVPNEEKVKYSAMTGQSLFYMGETNIKNKILAIVEEEGAHRTSYALKLLQSEGELSIASTGKDPITGELTTKEYRVEGPVMIFSTTTNIDIDEELQNRCLILTVDESREQTRAIHQMQRARRTMEGLQGKEERAKLLILHCNAQRLLRPLFIINPFSRFLTFLDDKTRTRRDHEKYLTLIDSIALLHQYQRKIIKKKINGEVKEALVVSIQDIEIANNIANEVLGRSLDELPPHTRCFLDLVHEMVRKECEKEEIDQIDYRFYRRQICEYTGWSLTQVRVHLQRLIDHEYVLVHRGKRGQSFVYELLYQGEGKENQAFLMGLIDVNKLKQLTSRREEPKQAKAIWKAS